MRKIKGKINKKARKKQQTMNSKKMSIHNNNKNTQIT